MKRESFGSRLGFLLVSAGCAIGIGNVWRFPYVTGQNGGGLFVVFYLIFLIAMGAPVLTMELAVGRAGRSSAIKAYRALEPKGSRWHIHGVFCVIGCYLLMMYYTTVSGWMLGYFFKFASGQFAGLSGEAVDGVFSSLLASPGEMTLWMAVTVLAGFLVVSFGLQKGLERISKVMMAALLVLMILLSVHAMTLPGASAGLRFYLVPDVQRALDAGIGNVLTAAMNQSFFTLSLGIGAIAVFGSYIDRDRSLMGEAVTITALDTFVALSSGLIIFPAYFTFNAGAQGIPAEQAGAGFLFTTLSSIFNSMAAGRVVGTLFFLFMIFAALSTVIAVFENIVSFWLELTKLSRRKIAFINVALMLLLSLPCVFSLNIWSGVTVFGKGFMDLEDYLVSNLLLPLGSLFYVIFCTSRYGWGWERFELEANSGRGLKLARWLRPYMTYVLPLIILLILIISAF